MTTMRSIATSRERSRPPRQPTRRTRIGLGHKGLSGRKGRKGLNGRLGLMGLLLRVASSGCLVIAGKLGPTARARVSKNEVPRGNQIRSLE